MTLAKRIKRIRGKLSQGEFASRLGTAQRAVSSWETEQAAPGSKFLEAMNREFGVNLNWLLTEEGEPYIKDREQEHRTADPDGLWGKTAREEVEGAAFDVTTFGPRAAAAQPQASALAQAVDMLATVLTSGDQVFIQALMSNLIAFSTAVKESKRQSARIAELERRLAAIEAKMCPDNEGCKESAAM